MDSNPTCPPAQVTPPTPGLLPARRKDVVYQVVQWHSRQADCRVTAPVVDPQQAVLDDVARREDDVWDKEAELFIA